MVIFSEVISEKFPKEIRKLFSEEFLEESVQILLGKLQQSPPGELRKGFSMDSREYFPRCIWENFSEKTFQEFFKKLLKVFLGKFSEIEFFVEFLDKFLEIAQNFEE